MTMDKDGNLYAVGTLAVVSGKFPIAERMKEETLPEYLTLANLKQTVELIDGDEITETGRVEGHIESCGGVRFFAANLV